MILFNSCAYFNTFYNAKLYYKDAEKVRLQNEGESIPITAMDKYGKVIEKCNKVLKDYPDSRYIKEATLLMAQARYYREDYNLAIENLKNITIEDNLVLFEYSKYWTSLCKWKKGNSQTALDELKKLLNNTKSKEIKSKCHLSLAEIYKELKNTSEMIFHLQNSAHFSKNRNQKSIIYGRLAEIAFNRMDYDVALKGYKNVIANSLSKEKIETAHLQILKIMRLGNNYQEAEKKVKTLLLDDKFKNISGNLELELVQLYKSQGEVSEVESRLQSIVNNYPKSSISAEAFFQLGQIYSSEKWDLKKAKEYFDLVSKESNKSLFLPMANSRIKSIEDYENAEKDLENHELILKSNNASKNLDTDSTSSVITIETPSRTIPELYYQLGDLEAFSFNRYDKGIYYLNKIIKEYKESPYNPKSYFTIAYIYEIKGDTLNALKIRDELLELYPNSDYSNYMTKKESQKKIINKINKDFKLAESLFYSNNQNSLKLFKTIINQNSENQLAPFAAFKLANFYDQSTEIDSAIKYYEWIIINHPKSAQSFVAENRKTVLNTALSSLLIENKLEE